MTDIVALADRLRRRIEWQAVPEDLYPEDLTYFLAEAIRYLYVITGRGPIFEEDMLVMNEEGTGYVSFSDDLWPDEKEYILITAEIEFYKKAQSDVDQQTSYSTDAMAVTHGDKPFANLQKKIDDAKTEQLRVWFKMPRFHHL